MEEWKKIVELPTNNYQKISKISSYFRRMLRTDVISGTSLGEDLYLATKYALFLINIKNKTYQNCTPKEYKSPLNMKTIENLEGFKDGIYYGDYSSNIENEVSIYFVKKGFCKPVFTFPKGTINHIHNIVKDAYNKCLWILTGDFGTNVGIYKAKNNFSSVEPIKLGKQEYRSCVAFPPE